MPARRMMGGGVMARRVVATADVAARLAHPQMNPARAYGQAFLATGNRLGELEAFDRVEVAAGGHEVIVTASDPSHAPIRNARVREERAAWCTSNRVSSARCRTGSSREHPGSELRPLRAGLVRWAAADARRRDGARTHVDPSDRGRQLGAKARASGTEDNSNRAAEPNQASAQPIAGLWSRLSRVRVPSLTLKESPAHAGFSRSWRGTRRVGLPRTSPKVQPGRTRVVLQ